MTRSTMRACALAWLLGCGPKSAADEGPASESSTDTSGGGTTVTSGAPTETGIVGDTGSSTTAAASSSGGTTACDFICEFDVPPDGRCDGWIMPTQDCPEGQKCTIDDAWNETHCVDVVDDPKQVDEPCTMTGSGWSGFDDCAAGLVCWNVDAEGHGTCVAYCLGTVEGLHCADPTATCVVCQDCAVGFCIPGCDPLAQDCPSSTDVCIDLPGGEQFQCVLDASGEEGQAHDPCMFANSCDAGLLCVVATAAVECSVDSMGCCEPFCALSGGDAQCPGMGQMCAPFFPDGAAPPQYEDVGICTVDV